MSRGVYIVANDKVCENAIALLNSIRLHNAEIPVYLIPFNDDYQKVATQLQQSPGVKIYPDLAFLNQFTEKIGTIFDRDFLALPNKMRKLVAWFGPLDEFLYIDTDIIVFEDVANSLNYLDDCGFICCDYHHRSEGLKNVFAPDIRERGIFTEEQLGDVFNSGFWGSKKSAITQARMVELLQECAQHREYFDFSSGVTDQPILNYLILKQIPQRCNLVKTPEGSPGSWAGSKHFRDRNWILYDQEKPLKYLHWAGIAIRPGSPYWSLWEHYRYLNEAKPPEPNLWQKWVNRLTKRTR